MKQIISGSEIGTSLATDHRNRCNLQTVSRITQCDLNSSTDNNTMYPVFKAIFAATENRNPLASITLYTTRLRETEMK